MPTYVYDCPKCGQFEVEQSIKDDSLKTCAKGHPVKRNITFCQLVMPETSKAAYFAGREGDKRIKDHQKHNQIIADKVKSGEYDNPRRNPNQPMESFNDMERRLKA